MKKLIILLLFGTSIAAIAPRLCAQWSADSKISTTDTTASLNENMGQCLAVSGDSVHVIWSDRKTDTMAIYYRHSYDAGLTWSAITRIAGFSKSVDLPSIAVNGSTVHVTWRDNTAAVPISYYRRSLDGGNTWGNPVSLGNYVFWPNVTCSGSLVIVGLNDSHPGNSEVYLRRSTDNGTSWSDSIQISHALDRSEDQSIAAAGGFVHMAWNDKRTGIMQTWYSRSTDNGATWGQETQFTNTTGFAYFPIVHTSGANVDVAWGEHASGVNVFDIFFKTSSDYGATWSAQQQLTHGTSSSAYPTIARDGKNVYLVWGTFGGDTYYEHSGDGGITWDPLKSLVSVAGNPFAPFIVVSGPALHVIWIDKREGHPEVYYKRNPTGNPVPDFRTTSSIDFGDVRIISSQDTSIVLRNLGTASVKILKYSMADPKNGFMLLDTSVHSIAARDSATIKVRFTAAKEQTYIATITIVTDEGSSNSHQIQLAGTGTNSKLDIPNAVDFGDVKIVAMRDSMLMLKNTGSAQVNITGYYLSDPSGGFVLLDTIAHLLAPHDYAWIKLRFNAAKEQSCSGTLTITTDEAGLATHRIALSGRGVNSKLTVSPTVLSFGNVDSGKIYKRAVLVSNGGTASVVINSFVMAGSAMFTIDQQNIPDTMMPGNTLIINVTFYPTAVGPANATLTIAAAEGTQPQVLLSGTALGKKDTTQASVRMTNSPVNLLEVTPNPASTNATLKIRTAKNLEDVKLNFYNAAGKLLSAQNIGMLGEGMQNIPLMLPAMSGIVFMRITSGEEIIGTAQVVMRR